MTRTPAPAHVGFALLLLGLSLAACENAVEPLVRETTDQPFFLYGYLDTEADTQFVRVAPIVSGGDHDPSTALDATVRTQNQATGTTRAWSDSLVRLDDGSTGHLYYAAFRPEPGASYALEVVRSDGATTRAVTRIPPRPLVDVDSVDVLNDAAFQDIGWAQIPGPPLEADVVYEVSAGLDAPPQIVRRSYTNLGQPGTNRWDVTLRLSQDRQAIGGILYGGPSDDWPVLYQVRMDARFASPEWNDPLGSNITNGTGFFGSIATFSSSWTIPGDVLTLLEFINRQTE